MKVLDLFSGIGGFSLGLERAGMETVAFCEIDPFCQKVLRKHWPGVRIHDDITNTEFTEDVGLVTAGFPCQDESHIGKRAGITGANTGLFWYILRAIRMVGRPKLLLENVAALLSGGMGVVLGALASIGYDAEWHCIPAGALGAPHERDRVWIVASDPEEEQRIHEPYLGKTTQRLFADCIAWEACPWGAPENAVCRMDDGVQVRLDGTLSCGNAVVPQIPEIIGKAIMEVPV